MPSRTYAKKEKKLLKLRESAVLLIDKLLLAELSWELSTIVRLRVEGNRLIVEPKETHTK